MKHNQSSNKPFFYTLTGIVLLIFTICLPCIKNLPAGAKILLQLIFTVTGIIVFSANVPKVLLLLIQRKKEKLNDEEKQPRENRLIADTKLEFYLKRTKLFFATGGVVYFVQIILGNIPDITFIGKPIILVALVLFAFGLYYSYKFVDELL